MGPTQKRVTIGLWAMVGVALAGLIVGRLVFPRPANGRTAPGGELTLLSSATNQPASNRGQAALFDAPNLTLIDQDGHPFSTASLRGRPWVADFIFTTCGGLCPIMSHQMSEVQKQTPTAVNLVSFTVDPAHDSPAVLREYGHTLNADFSRWHFLTGTPAQMADAAFQMKISVRPADGSSQISHSEKFLLIDGAAKVVGIYDGTNARDVKQLIADAATLAARAGSEAL